MKAKYLQKKYPDLWEEVEQNVLNNMEQIFETKSSDDNLFKRKRMVVAYNAAFFAVNALHKRKMLREIIKDV